MREELDSVMDLFTRKVRCICFFAYTTTGTFPVFIIGPLRPYKFKLPGYNHIGTG